MPLPLYVRTTRFTQFPHFSSRWPAVSHWEWMFTTVDHTFYDRVEVNDRLTESSCFSGLWPVNLLLTQTLHCIALLSCYHTHPLCIEIQCLSQSRSKAALQCWLVSPYWPVCVSECSCVRTVSDLLGEFSHFSAATWLSWAAFLWVRAEQVRPAFAVRSISTFELSTDYSEPPGWAALGAELFLPFLASGHYHFKSGHIWGIFINRTQTATWLSCILK